MKYFFLPSSDGIVGYKKNQSVKVFVNKMGKKNIVRRQGKITIRFSIPLIRGLIYFFQGLVLFFDSIFDSIKNQNEKNKEDNRKMGSIFLLLVVLSSMVLSFFVLGFIPAKISLLLLGLGYNSFIRNIIIALIKILLIVGIVLLLRCFPSCQDLFRFNGAINLVELNKGEIKNNKKDDIHNPLNFLNFLFFTFILSIFVVTLVGISISFWSNWLVNFAIFMLCISLSYEACVLLCKFKNLRKICLITSFFVVMKPKITHDEVARLAYMEIGKNERSKGELVEEGKIPLASVFVEMQTKLSKENKYEKSDVDWIVATILGKNRNEIKLVKYIDEKNYREIMKATAQRAEGKPLSAIFGFVDFFGLRFNVNKKVLAPRMETEILVDEVLDDLKNNDKKEILDVGTGSGAIAISIAKNSKSKVFALDISNQALEIAKENAKNNGVKIEFIHSDLFQGLKKGKKFDIIVSNPPYIRSLDIEGLDDEVKKYDPRIALDGGSDGLYFYKKIISEAHNHLKPNGKIFLEIGKGQHNDVKKLLTKYGFIEVQAIKDYNKIYRVVKAKYGNGK